jgi:hypothetical protein
VPGRLVGNRVANAGDDRGGSHVASPCLERPGRNLSATDVKGSAT